MSRISLSGGTIRPVKSINTDTLRKFYRLKVDNKSDHLCKILLLEKEYSQDEIKSLISRGEIGLKMKGGSSGSSGSGSGGEMFYNFRAHSSQMVQAMGTVRMTILYCAEQKWGIYKHNMLVNDNVVVTLNNDHIPALDYIEMDVSISTALASPSAASPSSNSIPTSSSTTKIPVGRSLSNVSLNSLPVSTKGQGVNTTNTAKNIEEKVNNSSNNNDNNSVENGIDQPRDADPDEFNETITYLDDASPSSANNKNKTTINTNSSNNNNNNLFHKRIQVKLNVLQQLQGNLNDNNLMDLFVQVLDSVREDVACLGHP